MAYQPRAAARSRQAPAPELAEARLTIPDALVAWACDNDRQIAWSCPFGNDVAEILRDACEAPLMPSATERLLSRLDAIVSAALREGRGDLLTGLDLQTAEWLGLNFHAETTRGHLHVGPDPRTQAFEKPEPPWTYREVRVVYDAKERAAVDLAWKAKELLLDSFPDARISSLEHEPPVTRCCACGEPAGSVMLATISGGEYHSKCWLEMVSPMPEHLTKLLKKTTKAR